MIKSLKKNAFFETITESEFPGQHCGAQDDEHPNAHDPREDYRFINYTIL
jgi:hypothetical protein